MTAAIESRAIPDPEDDPTPSFADVSASTDAPPDDGVYRCEVCGTPISTPSGRKPRVMLCDEHRTGKAKNTASSSAASNKTHAKIAQGMQSVHVLAGLLVGSAYIPTRDPAFLADKTILHDNAERLGEAWAKVTDTDPKLRKNLEKFLDRVGYMTLLGAYAPVAIGIVTNHTPDKNGQKPAEGVYPMDDYRDREGR